MKVLLVSPAFHGYWHSYARALESLGHDVNPVVYQHFPTLRARLRNKLLYEARDRLRAGSGTAALAHAVTDSALRHLADHAPDAVIAIKGDVLEPRFWDELDRRALPSLLYLYDDLEHMRHDRRSLARARRLATISGRDAGRMAEWGLEAVYVPMAFDPEIEYQPVEQDAVVFVGSRYGEREATLAKLAASGIPVAAYGREWSPRLQDRLRTWELRRPQVPGHPDVTLAESLGLAAGAAAAVNLHAGRDGFNPRTFEIAGAGGLQLIDRPDVEKLYEPGREVLVFRSDDELHELAGRSLRDRGWARSIRHAARERTLSEHTYRHRSKTLLELL